MYDKYINLFLILILFRVHSNLIDECCKDVNNHTILFNCVNTTLSNHKSQNSNVAMAIFASKNIKMLISEIEVRINRYRDAVCQL